MEIELRCYSFRKQTMFYSKEFRVKFNRDGARHVLLCDPLEPDQHYEKRADYQLMMWTTLRDKYGRKIYEHDLVRAYKPNSYLDGTYEVIWNKELGRWEYNDYFGKTREYTVGNNQKGAWCKVVGNIYESKKIS